MYKKTILLLALAACLVLTSEALAGKPPPGKATEPNPADGATDVDINADLSWTEGKGADSHDVYFGTTSPGDFQVNQTETTFEPGTMAENTTYYWCINEVGGGGTTTGDVWSFTTGTAAPPGQATNPDPRNGATGVSTTAILSWTAGSGADSHDVYFGTISPGDFQGNQTATTFNPGTMAESTTYYWRIDEVNPYGTTTGDVWSFTTGSGGGTANFIKGPYLIYPGDDNTQMQVLWQLDENVSCTIEWGTDTTYSDGSANTSQYGDDFQHSYTIGNLTPGTMYYYRVTVGENQSTGSFGAAPATSATDVKFLMYGDTRTNPDKHDSVAARMIATYNADPLCQTMILLAGDWVTTDSESAWTSQFFNYSYGNLMENLRRMPIQGIRGNHEGDAIVYAKYWPYPYVGGCYWSFDYGPVHVSIVDQYTDYAQGSAQYNWLVDDLSGSTKPWKIIALHEPGWSASGHNNTKVQSRIQPLCGWYGVQIVLAGHEHYYARAVVDGIQHITSGGGGAPSSTPEGGEYIVAMEDTLNFQKVEVDGNLLTCTTYRPDGSVVDTFNLIYQGPPPGPDTFYSTDDAAIEDGSTVNKGDLGRMPIKKGTAYCGYLKFTVSTESTITGAKLRLKTKNQTGTDTTVYEVADNSWDEMTLNGTNEPAMGTALDTLYDLVEQTWYEFDVSAFVTANGTYSLGIQTTQEAWLDWQTKEGSSSHPELVLTFVSEPDTTPPANPTGLTATAGDTQVSLDWDDNTEGDLSHYNVYRDTTSGGPYTQIATNVTVSNYTDTGLVNGTTYYYVVTAVDTSSNESGNSNEASATPAPDSTPPAAPSSLTAAAGDTQVDLDWADNTEPDLSHYNVWRATTTGGPYDLVVSGLTTSAYTNTGLTNGTTYYYVVTAVDTSDNESDNSNEASATPVAPSGSETFYCTDDAAIRDGLTTNYGDLDRMPIKQGTAYCGYMKFTVSGMGPITGAKLWLKTRNQISTDTTVYEVADNSWEEMTINGTNEPAMGTALDTLYNLETYTWYEFDVSAFVTANGTYSLGIQTTQESWMDWQTKEGSDSWPELVVTCE